MNRQSTPTSPNATHSGPEKRQGRPSSLPSNEQPAYRRDAQPDFLETPALSIVIPSFNGLDVLRDCLESVTAHRPNNSEVIVVDDGSSDGTTEWVRQHQSVGLVQLARNSGFCAAVNAGIRAARAPVIETLNNDTVVTARWADAALPLFQDPTVGSVAPLVWLTNEPGLIDSAGIAYHVAGFARNRGNRQARAGRFEHVEEVFGATASAAFYRRDALLGVGGFPENFGAYYDDIDVAFRLQRAGYRCLFTPHSQVLHRESFSHKRNSSRPLTQFFRNEERVFWSNMPWNLLWSAAPRHLVFLASQLPLMAWRRQGGAYIRGKTWGLCELPTTLKARKHRNVLAQRSGRLPQLSMERALCWRLRQWLRQRSNDRCPAKGSE